MENNTPTIKKIPNCITKQHLLKIYHPFPKKDLMDIVNEIIIVNRKKIKKFTNKSDANLKRANYVFKEEFIELTKQIGFPDGYEI